MGRKGESLVSYPWVLISSPGRIEKYRPSKEVMTRPENRAKTFNDSIHYLSPRRVILSVQRSDTLITLVQLDISIDWSMPDDTKQFRVVWDMLTRQCTFVLIAESVKKKLGRQEVYVRQSVDNVVVTEEMLYELVERIRYLLRSSPYRKLACWNQLIAMLPKLPKRAKQAKALKAPVPIPVAELESSFELVGS